MCTIAGRRSGRAIPGQQCGLFELRPHTGLRALLDTRKGLSAPFERLDFVSIDGAVSFSQIDGARVELRPNAPKVLRLKCTPMTPLLILVILAFTQLLVEFDVAKSI